VWQNVVGEKDKLCGARWIMRDLPNYVEAPADMQISGHMIAQFHYPYLHVLAQLLDSVTTL